MIKPTDPTTPKKIAIQSVLISEVQAMNEIGELTKYLLPLPDING